MGNKLAYILIATGFAALIFLNPGQDRHRRAFMDYAHTHFFELPKTYQEVYEQILSETHSRQVYERLRYGNFILFSTLSHDTFKRTSAGRYRERRPLTIGALGFIWPVIIERSKLDRPAIDQ